MSARRASRIERTCKRFTRHTSNAQLVRFRNQLLKDHRTMAKRFGSGEILFANAVRVDERCIGIHADRERAEQLRYCFTFSFCEELSSCGGVVRDECAWNTQTRVRGEPELSLLVLGVALAIEIVYPENVLERVEKAFECGG